jgi:uncharacterized protein (DUF1697 family)
MALVVLLKGINVGGHRTFRPSVLAKQLEHLDVVNLGAAGTFVVRGTASRTKLRTEIARRLPFDAAVMICNSVNIVRLAASDPFAGQPRASHIVQFVSLLAKRREPMSALPVLPADSDWCLKVLGQRDRFVFGVYRREMKAISYLGQLEKLVGVPMTTRNWNTISAIVNVLKSPRNGDVV